MGRTGKTLQEYWAGEPHAFLGITVPEFPNFFILYGPGTNGGEIVTMLESQAEYAVRAMKRMRRERVTAVEVRPSFDALVEPLAPVADAGHLLDDEQQLLQGAHRQGRHPVADRLHRCTARSPRCSAGSARRPAGGRPGDPNLTLP